MRELEKSRPTCEKEERGCQSYLDNAVTSTSGENLDRGERRKRPGKKRGIPVNAISFRSAKVGFLSSTGKGR